MNWNDLSDAWPTTGINPPKYSMATPPVYSTSGEAGLTNIASVNDVVFVGTTKPDFTLWTPIPDFVSGRRRHSGPALTALVLPSPAATFVAGTGDHVCIYSL